jgi:fermentation-respiration switch protein FrsA (DUF1100 family)
MMYLFGGYIGLLGMLLFLENRLIYHPSPVSVPAPTSDIQDIDLASADGTRIHAWWYPAKESKDVLLYCHGNAGNLSHRGPTIIKLSKILNTSVLIFDYPGYGKSEGKVSEKGCFDAADAAYQWLTETQKAPSERILLFGASLGGGVATDLAARKDHRALVLVKTFTSLPDVASDLYWWLPAPTRLLMSNQMNSLAKIKNVQRPVFIAHGTKDNLIPFSHGKRLFDAANAPKHFYEMDGAGHNDGLSEEFFNAVKEFLRVNSN